MYSEALPLGFEEEPTLFLNPEANCVSSIGLS